MEDYAAQNRRKATLFLLALALLAAAYILISAAVTAFRTGTLDISTNNTATSLIITSAGKQAKTIIGSSARLRLAPGTYQITTVKGNASTRGVSVISLHKTSRLVLVTHPLKTATDIATYTAQDIYTSGDTLYFINTPFQQPYSLQLSNPNAKINPIFTAAYPVQTGHWLNADTFLYKQPNGRWLYTNSANVPNTLAAGDVQPDSVSTNTAGQIAYISNSNQVMLLANTSSQPQLLGKVPQNTYRTALAENGTVLAYAPLNGAKAQASYLLTATSQASLPPVLNGIDSARWSDDGKWLAYATADGINLYDTVQKSSVLISTNQSSNLQALAWSHNNQLLYADSSNIWQYTPSTRLASKIAAYKGNLNGLNPLYITADSQQLIYGTSVDSNNQGGEIESIKL